MLGFLRDFRRWRKERVTRRFLRMQSAIMAFKRQYPQTYRSRPEWRKLLAQADCVQAAHDRHFGTGRTPTLRYYALL